MEYTTKWKLSKPTYDDDVDIQVLNNNFDIIDGKLQTVSVSDNTLHVDDKSYPLNYMPITGGNFTGDITIMGKPLYRLVNEFINETEKYKQIVRQYEDGTQTVNIHTKTKTAETISVTLLQPFIDDTTTGTYALDTDVKDDLVHYDWFWPIYITKTECAFNNGSTKSKAYTSIVLTGRWK